MGYAEGHNSNVYWRVVPMISTGLPAVTHEFVSGLQTPPFWDWQSCMR